MADITVPTSPPGVWPKTTVDILDTTYAQVEADVLRRKPGKITEDSDKRDKADNALRASSTVPNITVAPTNQSAAAGANATFTVTATGTPTPQYRWFITTVGGARVQLASTTGSQQITAVSAGQNAALIEVEVRNHKGTVTASATLTVT